MHEPIGEVECGGERIEFVGRLYPIGILQVGGCRSENRVEVGATLRAGSLHERRDGFLRRGKGPAGLSRVGYEGRSEKQRRKQAGLFYNTGITFKSVHTGTIS